MRNKGFMKRMMTAAAITMVAFTLSTGTPVMAGSYYSAPATVTNCSTTCANTTGTYTVYGTTNYLALRNACYRDSSNEIGRIFNGDTVQVTDVSMASTGYVYVYSPTLNMYGYVNKSYLTQSSSSSYSSNTYRVYGTTNYLALRNDTCYSSSNEIGRIFNGDTVQVTDSSMAGTGYVYVYSPTLNMYGYVNKSYLTPVSGNSGSCYSGSSYSSSCYSGTTKIVRGTTNYLALRTATCYDDSNEIGKIYNGDTVQLLDSSMAGTGYVYVYSPTLNKNGYVNKDYLY